MTGLSDVDLDRIEESPRLATDGHVVQLVAEVRRLRAEVSDLEDVASHLTRRGAVLESDRALWRGRYGRLAEAIRTHRDETDDAVVRLGAIEWDKAVFDACNRLWAALDPEDDRA